MSETCWFNVYMPVYTSVCFFADVTDLNGLKNVFVTVYALSSEHDTPLTDMSDAVCFKPCVHCTNHNSIHLYTVDSQIILILY